MLALDPIDRAEFFRRNRLEQPAGPQSAFVTRQFHAAISWSDNSLA
jgi:hypothetical protein